MLCIVHNHNTFDIDILGNPQFKSKLSSHKLKNFVKDKKLRDFYTAIKIKNKEERVTKYGRKN